MDTFQEAVLQDPCFAHTEHVDASAQDELEMLVADEQTELAYFAGLHYEHIAESETDVPARGGERIAYQVGNKAGRVAMFWSARADAVAAAAWGICKHEKANTGLPLADRLLRTFLSLPPESPVIPSMYGLSPKDVMDVELALLRERCDDLPCAQRDIESAWRSHQNGHSGKGGRDVSGSG